MKTHVVTLILFLGLGVSGGIAAESNRIPEDLRQLVSRLGDTRYTVRHDAAVRLIALGEPALTALKQMPRPDEETRDRADKLIRIIERRLLNESLLRPPMLRLKYENVPLHSAVLDLRSKTGLPFELDRRCAHQLITLDTGEKPFWQAIEEFLTTAEITEAVEPHALDGIAIYSTLKTEKTERGPRQGEPRILLVHNTAPAPVWSNGSVRVKALPAAASAAVIARGVNEIPLILDVMAAPRLNWGGCVSTEIHAASDENNAVLAQSDAKFKFDPSAMGIENESDCQLRRAVVFKVQRPVPMNRRRQVVMNGNVVVQMQTEDSDETLERKLRYVPIALQGAAKRSKKIAQISGTLTAEVLTGPQPLFTIRDVGRFSGRVRMGARDCVLEMAAVNSGGRDSVLDITLYMNPPESDYYDERVSGQTYPQIPAAGQLPTICLSKLSDKPISASIPMEPNGFDDILHKSGYRARVSIPGGNAEPIELVVASQMPFWLDVPFVLTNVPVP